MVPLLGDLLLPIVTNIIEALVPNLASKQTTIHNTAETVLELITQCISESCVCVCVCVCVCARARVCVHVWVCV